MKIDSLTAAYHVSAGIDYNSRRAGVYEFTIFDAKTEALMDRASYYKSKRAAISAAKEWVREFEAGKVNGAKHGSPIPHSSAESAAILYAENLRKAETGVSSYEPLIRAYWKGYSEGLPV